MTSTDRSEDPMDISAYRRRLEAELASDRGHEADQATEAPTAALASALDPAADPEARAAALRFAASAIGETPGLVTPLLTLIADSDQPIGLRTEALVLVQEFSFRSVALPGVRPDFLATLRGLVDDPDMDLRRRVIGVLAREKDEFVQRRLLDGLEGRTPALVPAAKAIQYLATTSTPSTSRCCAGSSLVGRAARRRRRRSACSPPTRTPSTCSSTDCATRASTAISGGSAPSHSRRAGRTSSRSTHARSSSTAPRTNSCAPSPSAV
ncbi:hypothetical protein BJF90_35020 [Pseudonocardia sp. CNS-004]|nr:hypothetical protein BJF90_35020 [Pseudonocardia sp. CNS-004]